MIYVFDYETLKVIWWAVVGVLIVGFAILDGFDLGVGILLPYVGRTDDERRVALNSVGPTWEGNQVWFITAGGATFAAWPLVYATAFSGFYIALIVVLFALFLRPVGFDYRSKVADPRWRSAWDWGLFVGGFVPALVFGVAFGNLLVGVPFHFDGDMRSFYTGSFFGLLNPFGLTAGLVSLTMLTMHGGFYLQLRTEGDVQARAARAARLAGIVFLALFAAAGFWVATGMDGFRIVTMPPPDSSFAPTAKTVERAVRRLARQLFEVSVDDRRAGRGLCRHAAGARAVRATPRRARVHPFLHRRRQRHTDRRVRALSVHHAVVEPPGEQPHDLGCGVEPSHAPGDALGGPVLRAADRFLYELGLSGDARQGHHRARAAGRALTLLRLY